PVAPLFMVIMGYFIATSTKSLSQLVIRGLKIICLGMFLNIALNFNLILSVNRGLFKIDLLPYIFGVDILHFAGISIIIIASLKKVLEKNIIFVLIAIVLSSFLGHFLLKYIPDNLFLKYISAFFYGSCKWSYFPLFPWLAYPLAGIAFYQIQKKYDPGFMNTTISKLITAVLFIVFLAFTLKYAAGVSSDLSSYYHHGLIFVLWVIVFLSLYTFFVNEINNFLGTTLLFNYLKWLGKNVTIIYIIQWIIIGNTATEIYKTISSESYLLICFLSILLLTSISGYLFLGIRKRFKY
ncbi:MAG: heparan-alpha-glucosaminide N-acetyltransferase domain-containing protein, partial [Bacteroidia bacterium]